MNVLVVTQYFWPENFRINDLVADLVRRGHNVTVLTGYPNYPEGKVYSDFTKNPENYDNYDGAEVIRIPLIPRGSGGTNLILNYISFAINASLLGLFRLRNRVFDVIFVCQLSPVTVGIPAIVFRYFKKVPIVFWVLDLWPETLSALGYKSKILLRAVGSLVGIIYNRCDLILGQSRQFINSIQRHTKHPDRFRYFPSWSESLFSEVRDSPAVEVDKQQNNFTIVFTGNIGEAQDFPAILDAMEHIKEHNVRLLIVGDGRDAGRVKEDIARRNLGENVKMLGRFPLERMPSFIAHADALLVSLRKNPAFSMTIPGKVQSYLMTGVPIIGMLDGAGAQVITDAKAGLVSPSGDSQGLAVSILRIKNMTEEQRATLGNNGRRFADKEFNRNKLIDQLEVWFGEMVVQKRKEV